MIRKIIHIDEEKCNGCGACVTACHEGAIGMVDGHARLLRDDYCDGLGDCLPACPTGAITFVEREAAAYDEQAVAESMRKAAQAQQSAGRSAHAGCPGSRMRILARPENAVPAGVTEAAEGLGSVGCESGPSAMASSAASAASQLVQWPVQIKLVPVNASYFEGAHLLIAADCTAFAYASFHDAFMKGRVTLVGCPKLDAVDYADKLAEIIGGNAIESVTVLRMEVPCCGGLEAAARMAVRRSGKDVSLDVVTIGIDGSVK